MVLIYLRYHKSTKKGFVENLSYLPIEKLLKIVNLDQIDAHNF
jgi:hypothetical protein